MSVEKLPAGAVKLILEAIESIEQLETLLLLAREPATAWTAAAVAKELRTSPRSAERWLGLLAKQKFLVDTGGTFRFGTDDADRAAQVAALASAYATHRVSVIELIFNRKTARLQTFADAFKIRGDE
jgi:hypothetical protein